MTDNFKLGEIKKGFAMQTSWNSIIHPKRYRIGRSKDEVVMFISKKLRGGWFPWKAFKSL